MTIAVQYIDSVRATTLPFQILPVFAWRDMSLSHVLTRRGVIP